MKVKEVLERINRQIQERLVGEKMDCNTFHEIVGNVVKRNRVAFGTRDFRYSTWNLCFDDEKMFFEFASLELERKDDMRTKWNPQWKVLSVEFKLQDEECAEMTFEEMKKHYGIKRVKANIQGAEDWIVKINEDMKKAQEQKEKYIQQLKDLEEVK